ncbi:Uncharacterised protein [Bordetella pertussis]|nr:Uncharacterised protein [Bordetella pertussis]
MPPRPAPAWPKTSIGPPARTWMLCSPWLVPWCPGSMDASVRSPAISGRAPTIGLRCGRCKTGGACAIPKLARIIWRYVAGAC